MRLINRYRAPKVQIEMDEEVDEKSFVRQVPFDVVVLSDLSGGGGPDGSRAMLTVADDGELEGLLACLQPRLVIEVPDMLNGSGTMTVDFKPRRMHDFAPSGLVETMQALLQADAVRDTAHVCAQLQAILHHPQFVALEARWRALCRLIESRLGCPDLRIHVVDMSKAALAEMLQTDAEADWRQGALFHLLRDKRAIGTREATAGIIVADCTFDHSEADVAMLRQLGGFCQDIHVPLLAGAASSVVGLSAWDELHGIADVAAAFESPAHAGWNELRLASCSRFIYLAMPRFLVRPLHDERLGPAGLHFVEALSDTAAACWANSAWLMAENVVRSFSMYGWFARIRGLESGGSVDDLPTHRMRADDGSWDLASPCEVALGYAMESRLALNGLMPLLHVPGSDVACFIGARSLHRPSAEGEADARTDADLGSRLSWLLCGCRCARYLERIAAMRDCDDEDTERWLQRWVMNYVDGDPEGSSASTQAYHPFASAWVNLLAALPGAKVRTAELLVQPHHQFNGGRPRLTFRIEWARTIRPSD